MKKIILAVFSVFLLSGCAVWQGVIHYGSRQDNNAGITPLPSYSGPKSRIAVGDFEIKAVKVTSEISSGLREMLIAALTNSNRFSVVEYQSLPIVAPEQEPGSSAVAQQAGTAERIKAKAADLILTAAITEFEPEASGGRAGLGGGGGAASGAMGGLLSSSFNKAHMALEIRISDASTSKEIGTVRLQGEASNVSGNLASGFFGNWGLGKGLSAYANTPMEKAMRICIIETVRYVVGAIPANYYKY
ncbi:MAG: CsgG/HfaB family protein [Candidatus Omnitrophota bacterium]